MEGSIRNTKPPEVYHQTFKKLLKDISENLLQHHNLNISDSFIIMMVKLVILDSEQKFILRQVAIRDEMDRLCQVTVERILSMTQIQRNIIRMQLWFFSNHFPRNELVHAHQTELENQVKDFIIDLKESVPRAYNAAELYYKKLIAVIITKIDMGPASDAHVVKDTEAALSSVFPQDELNLLATMSPIDREKEVRQLVTMTAGIRLYNRDLEPANHGAGIEDVMAILPDKIYMCASLLSDMRERNIQRLIRYTTLVKPYFMDENRSTKFGQRDISQEMLWVRQGLVMVHQLLVYINELSVELTAEDEACDNYTASFKQYLEELKETVRDNATVPTFMVYPKFIELAESWRRLQESVVFLDTLIELVKSLLEFSENDLKQVDPLAKQLSSSLKIPTETQFFDFPMEQVSKDSFVLATKIDFNMAMDPLSMMYSGFCVWSLVKGLGLVLLANPNLGVFEWQNRQFLLATAQGAEDFRRDPDLFIDKAIFIARRWPELIFLLKLQHEVYNPETMADSDRPQTSIAARISTETGIQTETHPVESNIVPGYTWNEWEYRRRALMLAKLHKCATRSSQTSVQCLKNYVGVQTYALKNARMQTMESKASEMPMSHYFWGLRGCHKDPPHIVYLSRDCALCLRCFVPKEVKKKKKRPCI